jgi:hypothetical protein
VPTTTSFTYTLPQVPSATTARVTAANHGMVAGDLVIIDHLAERVRHELERRRNHRDQRQPVQTTR